MTESLLLYRTRQIEPSDSLLGFRSGVHALDDYFKRHAWANDRADVGRAYVMVASEDELALGLPVVLGFYTLSMAAVSSQQAAAVLSTRLPRYPMPAALIGRLAVDERARGRRVGEALLLDALMRAVAASKMIACLGVIVDAKDEAAESFYARYDFVTVDDVSWPKRMFLPMDVARSAFDE
jgi:GNAT superfamily N-acetyltransferase